MLENMRKNTIIKNLVEIFDAYIHKVLISSLALSSIWLIRWIKIFRLEWWNLKVKYIHVTSNIGAAFVTRFLQHPEIS